MSTEPSIIMPLPKVSWAWATVVVGTHVDGLLLEAEGTGEPVDGGEGVAVAKTGDDGGAADFGVVSHGVKSGIRRRSVSWRNRGYPPPYCLRVSLLESFIYVRDLPAKYS